MTPGPTEERATSARPPSRGDRLLLHGLLLPLALVATLSPIRSYDYWWHLRTGSLILEQGAVPRADPYSFTRPGTPWVDHEWLSQVLLYLGHSALGPGALVLVKGALVLGLCFLMKRHLEREGHGPAGTAVLLLLTLAGAAFRIDVRPELATLLLVPLVLHLVVRARDSGSPVPLVAVVALTLLGINLHVGVILVPIILGAAWLATLLSARVRARFGPEGQGAAQAAAAEVPFQRRLLWTTLASLASIAANPYAFHVYAVPFRLQRLLAALPLQNQEWIRPTPAQFPIFFASVGLALLVLILGWRRIDPITAPALLGCAAMGMLHLRHIGLFFLVLPYGLARPARGIVERVKVTSLYRRGTREESVRPGFIAAAALLVAGVPLLLFLPPRPRIGLGMAADNEPAAAVDFLEREKIAGPLFNDVRFGGYLIWRRYPEGKVFIDGRNEIYPDLLREIGAALAEPAAWKRLLEAHAIDAAFLRYPPTLQKVVYPGIAGGPPRTGERAFSAAYFPSAEWALVYWDDDVMIFLRRREENRSLIARLEYRAIHPDDWNFLWASVLIHRIPVEPILAELERKMKEDPGCERARQLQKVFAAFAAGAPQAAPSPVAGG